MTEDELQSIKNELLSLDLTVLKRAVLVARSMKPPTTTPIPEQQSLLEKAGSMTKSYISRGLNNKKAADSVKSLRVLSCHGGEALEACPHRKNSEKFSNSFFCGACGCGDKQNTQLVNITNEKGEEQYSKLDFPKVYCPLHMPGFSNYVSTPETSEENSRKIIIETSYNVQYIIDNSNLDNGKVKTNEDDHNNETK
jgi:hypothetical protein